MTTFIIRARRVADGVETTFSYDNQTSIFLRADGTPVIPSRPMQFGDAEVVSVNQPGRKGDIKTLKISLGLSCNYECGYCSQRFVPHAEQTNPGDVGPFVAQLTASLAAPPARIEFWGGEPFVYWKTLKPLAEALRALYPAAHFNIITNGSLLDLEKNAWLEAQGFSVGLSHDGPGSAAAMSPNGQAHKIGHLSDLPSVQLKTATHWSQRRDCAACPVLQLCQGSCMFLEGPLWEAGCNSAYSDNVPFFAAAIEFLTGYTPYYIEGEFRDDRKDLFGRVRGVPATKQKRVIEIHAVPA